MVASNGDVAMHTTHARDVCSAVQVMESVSAALASTAVTEQLAALQEQLAALTANIATKPATPAPQRFDMCTQVTPANRTNASLQCTSPELRAAAAALHAMQRRINYYQANASAQCNLHSPTHQHEEAAPALEHQQNCRGAQKHMRSKHTAGNMLEQALHDQAADAEQSAAKSCKEQEQRRSHQDVQHKCGRHSGLSEALQPQLDNAANPNPADIEEQNSCNHGETRPPRPCVPTAPVHHKPSAPRQPVHAEQRHAVTQQQRHEASNGKRTKGHAQAAAAHKAAKPQMFQSQFPKPDTVRWHYT